MSLQQRRLVPSRDALAKVLQQAEKGAPSTLLCTGEAITGVPCPVLGFQVQENDGHTGDSPVEGHEDH